jgi:predicted acyltransferase
MNISQSLASSNQRYLALDVLRGLTIALMVIVNTPGSWSSIYSPFLHATWHGFTITDLVFPTFLFVVGNAMSFSLKKMEALSTSDFLKKIGKRALIIFAIGWGLNAFPFFDYDSVGQLQFIDLTAVRTLGVLQRIALCFFIAALVIYFFGRWGAMVYCLVSLLGYWYIMHQFGDPVDPFSLTGNAALKFDLWLIGPQNLYGGEGIPFDPEGILSTFPAVVNVIAGYFAGIYIQQKKVQYPSIGYLIIAGMLMIGIALVWDIEFPINKKIWTSSYVALTVGIDLILLASLILIIEVWKQKNWTYPLEVFGKNPLILYVLSGVIITILFAINIGGQNLQEIIYTNAFTNWLSPKNASLLFAFSYTLLIWLIGFWMDKKKIYIKV